MVLVEDGFVAEYSIRRAVRGNRQNYARVTCRCCVTVVIAGQLLDETFGTRCDNLNSPKGKF